MELNDLGFANITQVDSSNLSESIKETDQIFESLSEGRVGIKQAVNLIKQKRERLGLSPIVINKK